MSYKFLSMVSEIARKSLQRTTISKEYRSAIESLVVAIENVKRFL